MQSHSLSRFLLTKLRSDLVPLRFCALLLLGKCTRDNNAEGEQQNELEMHPTPVLFSHPRKRTTWSRMSATEGMNLIAHRCETFIFSKEEENGQRKKGNSSCSKRQQNTFRLIHLPGGRQRAACKVWFTANSVAAVRGLLLFLWLERVKGENQRYTAQSTMS